MSKLTAFLSKSKKKGPIAEKSAAFVEPAHLTDAPAPSPSVPSVATNDAAVGSTGTPAGEIAALDVVQPKALEQWRVDDDDVSEEGGAVVEGPALRGTRDDDEEDDGEVDLPSSKVKGNFEWKRKIEDSAPIPAEEPAEETEQFCGFRRRRKEMDLENPETFPDLVRAEQPAASSGSHNAVTLASQKKQKPRGHAAAALSFDAKEDEYSDVQKILSGDDIWTVLGGKWAHKWPRISLDETGTRSRLQKSQILRANC